jgi:hypothetical protein
VHLDRNLPPNLNDLITGKAKEIADMDSVALHDGEELLLPGWQAFAVLAADDGLVTHVISHVAEIDRAPQRFACPTSALVSLARVRWLMGQRNMNNSIDDCGVFN